MKCLEKDRTRRYDTANGLAADIQRHLANEPVVARPPSAVYKIQKAWQRNKLAFSAAAAVGLALVLGITVSTWQAVEATRARRAETDQRVAAQRAEATALAKQKEAEQARAVAETARVGEEAQRRRAEARTYAGDMNQAQQALKADNLTLARQLLDRSRPQPGQPDRRGWEWRYLWRQSRSDALLTLCQQQGRIAGLELSRDGQWLAVRTSAGSVSVWNLPSRREVLRAEGNWNAVAFSPTRPLLAMWNTAAPGTDGWLQFWDAEPGRFVSGTPIPDPAKSSEKCGLMFLPDGLSLVAHTLDELSLWRVSDGKQLAAYPIAISRSGIGAPTNLARETNLLAVAENDLRLRVIDLTSGHDVFTADAPGLGWLESAALSADGRVLATCSGTAEAVIRLWDVARGRPLGILEGHRASVSALVFWPDGKTLASASADSTIRIWDVESRRSLAVLRGHEDEVCRLALHPDNSTLISGGKGGTVMVWTNVTVARRQADMLAWKTGPHRVFYPKWSVSSAGDELLTVEPDGWLKHWHGPSFQHTELLFQIDPSPKEARFSQDHRWLATHDDGGEVKIWNIAQRRKVHSLRSSKGRLSVGKFLGDTTRLAVWSKQARTLAIHDAATGDRVTAWSHPELGVVNPMISADGRWCVTRAGEDGHLRELSTGRDLGVLPLAGRQELTFSPDGNLMSVYYGSGTVRLWELPSLVEREPLTDILGKMHWSAYSPNEPRLVMESDANESLKLWDLESGRPMLALSSDTDSSRAHITRFSADGSTIVAMHDMGTFDFWRAPSWEEITAAEANEKAENKKP
jgi:WD40 repeat protein